MDVREKLVELFISTIGLTTTDAEIYANDFIANDVTVQEWISVDDRLPDLIPCSAGIAYSEAVIVLPSGRKETIAVWDGSTWIEQFDYCELWGEKITHWMPLPLPPKGE